MTVLSRPDAALISFLPGVGGEIAVDSGLLPGQTGWRRLGDRGAGERRRRRLPCQRPRRPPRRFSRSTMVDVIDFPSGGYRFIKGVFPYSAGVAALPGYRIERLRFAEPLALAQGFTRIADLLRHAGRPTTAFCACELRSPAPFTEAGFSAFNRGYVAVLKEWGLFDAGANPVARANVCPE